MDEALVEQVTPEDLNLIESASEFTEEVQLQESARTDYPIKLIAPGKGSSAFYPAEVLQRDGPKVFRAGTHMYWNHPTPSQESERPEGDLNNLAAVLTEDAQYQESGPKGPGLYARAKVFSDYAQQVSEKGPHAGLSIRAAGVSSGKLVEGRPELARLTYAASVDFVTRAGAGGMVLTESATPEQTNTQEASDMDAAEITKLQESNRELALQVAQMQAEKFAERKLKTVNLPEKAKVAVLEKASKSAPITAAGKFDESAFTPILEAEISYAASLIESAPVVTGMGAAPAPKEDPAKVKESKEAFDAQMAETAKAFGLSEAATKAFIQGRAN